MKKNTLKNMGNSILISAVAVPALGVLAHIMGGGAFQHNDASLSHRFECAYNMNPNPEHKKFTSYQYVHEDVLDAWYDDNDNPVNDEGLSVPTAKEEIDPAHPDYVKFTNEEEYVANPFLTGAMYIGVAGAAYAAMRRRQKKVAANLKQMSR